jgi:hypothetical protein
MIKNFCFQKDIKNLKNNFYRDGFLHLKNFLDKKKLKNILKEAIKYKQSNNIKKNRILQIHKKVPVILDFFKDDTIKYFLSYVLNFEKICGLQSEFFFNPPQSPGFGYHQDDFFLRTGNNNSVNLWVPFVPTNIKNGTLGFIKGSHKLKILKKINLKNLHSNKKNNYLLIKYKKKICNCNIGDVILISNHVFHCSSTNKSNKNRYAMSLGYMNEGYNYNKGMTAKREQFKI